MAEPQLKIRLNVPRDFTSEQRQIVGNLVIQFIQDRTNKGRGINNEPFPPYSEEYKDSRDFKAAGKSSRVNLSQTGDTLASIVILSHGIGFVTIGFEAGSFENDKAVWLQRSDNGVSRKFLGIADDDLERIINRVRGRAKPEAARGFLNSVIANAILKRLGIE